MNVIYLDHSATTGVLPEVWEAMRPYFLEQAGNPASSHQVGRRARRALEDAREQIAHLLNAAPDEVLFTSGATEANNLALFGLAGDAPGTLVSSGIEHPCVLEPLQILEKRGFRQHWLSVGGTGAVEIPVALPEDPRLVSMMLVNHETGTLQSVAEMAQRLSGRAPLHCDAAAAAGKIKISFRDLGVTALTLSAHKFHGPQGIGVLVVKRPGQLRPLLFGGHQQQGKRPGTEPVPLAVGMAKALAMALAGLEEKQSHVQCLRTRFLEMLRAGAGPVAVNGPGEGDGVPHILNLSFPGCRADALLMALDLAGVACSTGSACSSGSLLPSPVLQAMGVAAENLKSAMRFSFSARMGVEEVEEAARRIIKQVHILRHTTE